jgi:pyruvate kinase
VHAVGSGYTSWEGYVEEGSGRAMIGLSYDKLCRDVKPGGRILLADGSITIQVRVNSCSCSATQIGSHKD